MDQFKMDDVTDEIVRARENIKNKYLAWKRGRLEEERLKKEIFKPITKSLDELAKKPANFSVQSTSSSSSGTTAITTTTPTPTLKPSPSTLTPQIFSTPNAAPPPVFSTSKHSSSPLSSKSRNSKKKKNQTPLVQIPIQSTPTSTTTPASWNTYDDDDGNGGGGDENDNNEGNFAKAYLNYILKFPNRTDQLYGLRRGKDEDTWYLGSKKVKIVGNDLEIENEKYQGTKGLFELITKRNPRDDYYSESDLETYKKIFDQTNAHKVNYSPSGQIAKNKSIKFKKFIPQLYPGAGLSTTLPSKSPSKSPIEKSRSFIKKLYQSPGLFKTYIRNKQVLYQYYDDPNELIDRLRLLLASRASGSSAHENEIIEILEELRELGYEYADHQ